MFSSFFFEGDGVALLANDNTSAEINSTPNFTFAEGFEGRLVGPEDGGAVAVWYNVTTVVDA